MGSPRSIGNFPTNKLVVVARGNRPLRREEALARHWQSQRFPISLSNLGECWIATSVIDARRDLLRASPLRLVTWMPVGAAVWLGKCSWAAPMGVCHSFCDTTKKNRGRASPMAVVCAALREHLGVGMPTPLLFQERVAEAVRPTESPNTHTEHTEHRRKRKEPPCPR